ncbi:30S ribosomal protein S6 [Robiginitomaculum antarcticum]|uniref:30S ribosomal protein S6 n=1 Tax=Robiginitomaculum antarcticum TaxID=437507 RepID=UPI00037DC15E|nr:30S ribosomal protein S6 [Robiginitomaculum antarcticum]
MALYEHVVMSRPDISSAQVDEIVENLTAKIADLGGSVGRTEYWGLRNLAYRVRKNRKAHYSLLQVEAPAGALHEVERMHRINEDILRYLTIRVEEHNDDQSPILAKREERKKRDRRD